MGFQKIRNIWIGILGLWLSAFFLVTPNPAFAAVSDYSKASLEQLVDDLTAIDSDAPGISQMANYETFIAEDTPAKFAMGLLGVPPPSTPPQMRELVRRGLAAMPVLISHMKDTRPTKLIVGAKIGTGFDMMMWREIHDEYDPRVRPDPATVEMFSDVDHSFKKPFHEKYVVKVGDVCYALIGQIVNRKLSPVRYQPTAGIIVNSPIESPSLAEQVSKDWSGLDATQHRNSLLADIHSAHRGYQFFPAFARLRYYYPDAYRSLVGYDLIKRTAFESGNDGYISPSDLKQEQADELTKNIKAANQGDSLAQFRLGQAYEEGQVVPKDFNEALKWYRKSAERGESWSQTRLGEFYYSGRGVKQDYAEALKWFLMAAPEHVTRSGGSITASNGDLTAQTRLADIYFKGGYGVQPNYVEAYYWASVAAMSKPSINDYCDSIGNRLTPDELRQVKDRLRELIIH